MRDNEIYFQIKKLLLNNELDDEPLNVKRFNNRFKINKEEIYINNTEYFNFNNRSLKEIPLLAPSIVREMSERTRPKTDETGLSLDSAIFLLRNNVNNIRNIPMAIYSQIEEVFIEEALKQNYMVDYNTPIYFKNLEKFREVVVNSIRLSVYTVDYISNLPYFESLIDIATSEALKQGYVFNDITPSFIGNNVELAINSIRKDIRSARYVSNKLISVHKNGIFKLIVLNGFYSLESLKSMPLSTLQDEEILDYYLRQMQLFNEKVGENSEIGTYRKRVKELLQSGLLTQDFSISNLKKVSSVVAEQSWNSYRKTKTDYFNYLFNRICSSLEANKNIMSALIELKFLSSLEDVIEEDKYALYEAFLNYHSIYHNPTITNKIELLEQQKEKISEYAALYVSKSKDEYIKTSISKYLSTFKSRFNLRADSQVVRKKVVEVKQKDRLKELFLLKDATLLNRISTIEKMYTNVDQSLIQKIIGKIITDGVSNLEDLYKAPNRFDEYERYETISRLINRLNSSNIKIDGPEVQRYRSFISLNGNNYEYSGAPFTEEEIGKFSNYKNLKLLFNKLRSQVMIIMKDIDDYSEITYDILKEAAKDIDFIDENFELSPEYLNYFNIRALDTLMEVLENYKQILMIDDYYDLLNMLFIKGNLLKEIFLKDSIGGENSDDAYTWEEFNKSGINILTLYEIISFMPKIRSFMSNEEISINNLKDIIEFKEMSKYVTPLSLAILGREVAKKIYTDDVFSSNSNRSERISRAAFGLMSRMMLREESTVPYIEGEVGNYNFSMYDSLDPTLLVSGIDTQACFRVLGNDNDALFYCALDKNGFVIKLTDRDGNFVGRAFGFRNGNVVYINQLRTVYDKVSNAYSSETKGIIEAFQKACESIVEISQNNKDEEKKIEFVVVTKSYMLSNFPSTIKTDVTEYIGKTPMDNKSEDWKWFVSYTPNLRTSKNLDFFNTDYGGYPLICMASSNGELTKDKINSEDVPPVYHRKRNKIFSGQITDSELEKVNRIHAIQYIIDCKDDIEKDDFTSLKFPQSAQIISGDNWYIIYGNGVIIDKNCLQFEDDELFHENSKIEFDECLNTLEKSLLKPLECEILEIDEDISKQSI